MTANMVQNNSTTTEKHLRQIADMLMLNGTLTNCPGLIHGKTGIAIFFFHYFQHTGNALLEDYAYDLINEIQAQIHISSSADYETGISGIGAGMDYLIRNNFLQADDDFFDDFDQRMYRAVMYDPWQDFSLYDGLMGYGRYWISRLPSMQARECLLCIAGKIEEKLFEIPIQEQIDVYCFLRDLYEKSDFNVCIGLLEQCQKMDLQSTDINRCFLRLRNSAIGNMICLYQYNRYFNQKQPDKMKQISDLDMEKSPVSMGLLTGYAGEGMLRLSAALNQTNMSWMQLL